MTQKSFVIRTVRADLLNNGHMPGVRSAAKAFGALMRSGRFIDASNGFFIKASEKLRVCISCSTISRYQERIRFYSRVIARQPNNAFAYFKRAVYLGKTGEIRGALEDLNKAISINANIPAAYKWRAICHGSLGNMEKAKEDLIIYTLLEKRLSFPYNHKQVADEVLKITAEAII